MQVIIKSTPSAIDALRRDNVPETVIHNIVGKEHTLEISENGMVLPLVINKTVTLWNIAAECYEIVER